MPTTKFFPNQASNFIAESQDTQKSLFLWDKETEAHLINKIYESIDDVALWFPESKNTQDDITTIYQIIEWLKEAIMILAQGKSVRVRPYGSSLRGIIKSGQLVELVPSEFNSIQIGDVVLVKWQKCYLLNKVIEIGKDTLLIGNNRRKIQGWVGEKAIIAKVAQVFLD